MRPPIARRSRSSLSSAAVLTLPFGKGRLCAREGLRTQPSADAYNCILYAACPSVHAHVGGLCDAFSFDEGMHLCVCAIPKNHLNATSSFPVDIPILQYWIHSIYFSASSTFCACFIFVCKWPWESCFCHLFYFVCPPQSCFHTTPQQKNTSCKLLKQLQKR